MKIHKITEASEYLEVVERRKLKLKMNQSNLMEFEKEANNGVCRVQQ
jgi:hypothetical protein